MRRILDLDQGFEGDVRFFGVSSVSVVELPGEGSCCTNNGVVPSFGESSGRLKSKRAALRCCAGGVVAISSMAGWFARFLLRDAGAMSVVIEFGAGGADVSWLWASCDFFERVLCDFFLATLSGLDAGRLLAEACWIVVALAIT